MWVHHLKKYIAASLGFLAGVCLLESCFYRSGFVSYAASERLAEAELLPRALAGLHARIRFPDVYKHKTIHE
jgi:hypothetical protein